MPAVCLSVLLGWCSGTGGNEARDGGTLSGAIFQSQYTSRSAHAVNQNHAPSGRVCALQEAGVLEGLSVQGNRQGLTGSW